MYKSDAMHGWGDSTEARGVDEEVYVGESKVTLDGETKRHGKGMSRWGLQQKECYSGEWLYDHRHGKGEVSIPQHTHTNTHTHTHTHIFLLSWSVSRHFPETF